MSTIERIQGDNDASRRSPSPKTKIDAKIIILGHGGVGKTSFINRYIHNNFTETVSTIGASFVLKKWKTFYLGIWDTAGQEKFTKISSYYCRGAQAAILAYDITDEESFRALDNYIKFLADADRDCVIAVIGTKLDLVEADPSLRQVGVEAGQEYANQHRAAFYETSAKTNINITSVFDRIAYQTLAPRLASEDATSGYSIDITGSKLVMASATEPAGKQRICCQLQ